MNLIFRSFGYLDWIYGGDSLAFAKIIINCFPMKRYTTEIKWGLIFTAVTLLWMVFEKLMGWHDTHIDQHATYTNIFAVLAIAVYVLALLDKRRRDLGGYMTWQQGFISGVIISVVVAILSPAVQLITHGIISPTYFEHAIAYAVSHDLSTQAEAESFFSLSSYLVQSAAGALLMGVVTAAVVALFVRRKGPSDAATHSG
jgi:hypothetical protein